MAMTIAEETYINNAIGKARGAYNNAIATARRNALRTGVNPSSGKFQALENSAQYSAAAGIASAATDASFNWLKQAQAQQNFDDEMAFRQEKFEFDKDQAAKANALAWAQFEYKKDQDEAAYLAKEAAAKEQAKAVEEENIKKEARALADATFDSANPLKKGEDMNKRQAYKDNHYAMHGSHFEEQARQKHRAKKQPFGVSLGTSGKGLLK